MTSRSLLDSEAPIWAPKIPPGGGGEEILDKTWPRCGKDRPKKIITNQEWGEQENGGAVKVLPASRLSRPGAGDLAKGSGIHIWELPGNYPVFTVAMVMYHYVERIRRILVTPIFKYNIYDH